MNRKSCSSAKDYISTRTHLLFDKKNLILLRYFSKFSDNNKISDFLHLLTQKIWHPFYDRESRTVEQLTCSEAETGRRKAEKKTETSCRSTTNCEKRPKIEVEGRCALSS